MARIPDAEIEQLKRDVSLVRLVEARGIVLRGSGDNLMGLCPFHDDKEPSLVVSPKKNVWHCLGACQAGGDVIAWVMKAERVSFRAAVEMLKKDAPSLAAPTPRSTTQSELEEIAEPDEPDAVVHRRVVDFYHATLKENVAPAEYLARRGLQNGEMIDHFKLGYANRTLAYRLPKKAVKSGAALRAQLCRLGILRESGHEHFSGSVVVPVFGEDGAVREMYGRRIGTPKERSPHLYLPSREGRRGVFNLDAFSASKELILCEALIDALTFWCAGFRSVTSAYGVEGFTKEMREAIVEHGITKLLIAYDRDDAGDRAAEKLAKELAKDGLEVFRVLFPRGMDANEYAYKVRPAPKALDTAIRGAVWMVGTRPVAVPDDTAPSASEEASSIEPEDANLKSEEQTETVPSEDAPNTAESTASPLAAPSAPPMSLDFEMHDEEVRIPLGDRRWRIRGLSKNTSYESLRVNLLVSRGDFFFVDTLELYSARARAVFLKEASAELRADELVLKSDLGKIVLKLEDLVHQAITKAVQLEEPEPMSEAERNEALALLRDPNLLDRILADFDKAGVVGEKTNTLAGYLACVSRKLDAPLAIVLQSSSAAGKSSLMEAVLRFMPQEERVQYSAMTGQSLFYMGETDLSHKILAIAEEEGAQSASYALKLLQSEGELTIASTGKDATTGKHVTHEYTVKGPVMIFLTTTAIEVADELLNRCIVLSVDEGQKQTAAIHERQREAHTLEGLFAKRDRDRIVKLHQNAQRLIEPLFVVNPFAKGLRFSSRATRARRDHMKYLTLIDAIALLHQHQRPVKEAVHNGERLFYVEVTEADIARADELAAEILDVADELPPQTKRLLALIEAMVEKKSKADGIDKSAVRFSRKDVRTYTRWSDAALKKHLVRLEDLEHLFVHSGGARRRIVYALQSCTYDRELVTPKEHWSPPGHPLVTPGGRPENAAKTETKTELVTPFAKTQIREAAKSPSYSPKNGEAQR